MTAWKLPLIVAAITVPIVAAFAVGSMIGVGGSGFGLAVAALVTATIVVIAARQRPRGPIESAPAEDARRHVLLVSTLAVEDPGAVAEISRAAELGTVPATSTSSSWRRRGSASSTAGPPTSSPPARRRRGTWWRRSRRSPRRASRPRRGSATRTWCRRSRTSCRPTRRPTSCWSARGDGEADEEASAELSERLAAGFHHVVLG